MPVTDLIDELSYSEYYAIQNLSDLSDEAFNNLAFRWFSDDDHEGVVSNFYLDSEGHVTIGIGHMVQNVEMAKQLLLQFKFRVQLIPDRKVVEQDIVDDWNSITKLWPGANGLSGRSVKFRDATKLILDNDAIRDLFEKDIQERIHRLKKKFPDYSSYPDPAKLGILEMYFNLGEKFFSEFPNFISYVKKQEWSKAGSESHRKKVGEQRLKDTVDLFEKAETIKKSRQIPPDKLKQNLMREDLKPVLEVPPLT